MIDQATVERIKGRYRRAMHALRSGLHDADGLDDQGITSITFQIVRHLMRGELGRTPTHNELDTILDILLVQVRAEHGY